MNGFHDTKWKCSHLTCHAENGSDTHSVRLHLRFHPLSAKGDVDPEAHTHVNVTCKQSFMNSNAHLIGKGFTNPFYDIKRIAEEQFRQPDSP